MPAIPASKLLDELLIQRSFSQSSSCLVVLLGIYLFLVLLLCFSSLLLLFL